MSLMEQLWWLDEEGSGVGELRTRCGIAAMHLLLCNTRACTGGDRVETQGRVIGCLVGENTHLLENFSLTANTS